MKITSFVLCLFPYLILCQSLDAQLGKRLPSERKEITDPVTGAKLVFLTSTPGGDHKIYPTHNPWTADEEWLIFRSGRVRYEGLAVNEKTGVMVQVTEGSARCMLNVARKSMKLYYMRRPEKKNMKEAREIVEVDLAGLLSDGEGDSVRDAAAYQRICGIIPPELQASGNMALDGGEEWIWFQVGREAAQQHLPEGTAVEPDFGPRHMGAGPGGIAGMNIHTGEIKYVVSVPFQVGHIQSNPWVPGQIVFCWETGGKAPQRIWTVNSDGTGLRPLYQESPYEWITHEAVIAPEEVAFAILGHRKIPGTSSDSGIEDTLTDQANPGQESGWGNCGNRSKPTGFGVVNIKTGEMTIAGQIPYGSGFWHVTGSADERFLAGDNFSREIYLIDRRNHEMMLLSAGHKTTAADHPHPTFSPDGTRIQIQSAMLSEDNRSLNICVIPVPGEWLKREGPFKP
ncbi:MAG: hypothetical protein JXR41_11785 [Bacteroidales bacterium]|nr:hypothetical protein [Bacteroidales bacterium]